MKICHIVSGDLWAGAEVVVFELIRGLQRSYDLQVSAILLNEGRLARELRAIGVRVYVADETQSSFAKLFIQIRAIINTVKPDIIHSHRYKENFIAFLLWLGRSRFGCICTQHGMPESKLNNFDLKGIFYTKLNLAFQKHFFQCLVLVSQDMKHLYRRRFQFKVKTIHVIHNGIHLPAATTKGQKGSSPLVIGSAGRLYAVKDFILMVKIARVLKDSTTNVEFRIAGDGPDRGELTRRIEKYGLEKTFFLEGHLDDMSDFYQRTAIYLNTSIHEGIPISVLEAMAHVCPIVAPDVGGFPEIIQEGKQGYLIKDRRPEEYAARLRTLLMDEDLRERMGESARRRIKDAFSVDSMSRAYCRLYQKMKQDRDSRRMSLGDADGG